MKSWLKVKLHVGQVQVGSNIALKLGQVQVGSNIAQNHSSSP